MWQVKIRLSWRSETFEKEGQALLTELDWLEEPHLGYFQTAIAEPVPFCLAVATALLSSSSSARAPPPWQSCCAAGQLIVPQAVNQTLTDWPLQGWDSPRESHFDIHSEENREQCMHSCKTVPSFFFVAKPSDANLKNDFNKTLSNLLFFPLPR